MVAVVLHGVQDLLGGFRRGQHRDRRGVDAGGGREGDAGIRGDVGADRAGEHDGDVYVRVHQLGVQAVEQQVHRGLGRAVRGLARHRHEPAHAGHGDEVGFGPSAQQRQEGLGDVQRTVEVHLHHVLDGVVRQGFDGGERLDDAGDEDAAIDRAVSGDHRRGQRFDCGPIGDVDGVGAEPIPRRAGLSRGLIQARAADVHRGHLSPAR